MDDTLKVWTTVGSAGTLTQADLAKVTLHQSIIQLGTDLNPPQPVAAASSQPAGVEGHLDAAVQMSHAVVRYNVAPVDGLFIPSSTGEAVYGLEIRYRGQVTARLMQVDLASGAETVIVQFNSASFPPTNAFQVQLVQASHASRLMDFLNAAYYVEANLAAPAIAVGRPAAISIIKIIVTTGGIIL